MAQRIGNTELGYPHHLFNWSRGPIQRRRESVPVRSLGCEPAWWR